VNFSQSTSKNRPRNTVTNTVIVLPAYHTPAPKPTGPAILSSRYSLNKISNRALATIKVDVNKKRTQSESGLPESKKIRLDLTDENNSVDQYDFMRDAQNFLKTTGLSVSSYNIYHLFCRGALRKKQKISSPT
jgi:hypothetical protein